MALYVISPIYLSEEKMRNTVRKSSQEKCILYEKQDIAILKRSHKDLG